MASKMHRATHHLLDGDLRLFSQQSQQAHKMSSLSCWLTITRSAPRCKPAIALCMDTQWLHQEGEHWTREGPRGDLGNTLECLRKCFSSELSQAAGCSPALKAYALSHSLSSHSSLAPKSSIILRDCDDRSHQAGRLPTCKHSISRSQAGATHVQPANAT